VVPEDLNVTILYKQVERKEKLIYLVLSLASSSNGVTVEISIDFHPLYISSMVITIKI
jgi:hypothetical protein